MGHHLVIRRALVALMALLLAGCGSTPTAPDILPAQVAAVSTLERLSETGQPSILLRPAAPPNGVVVIYHHGAAELADSVFTDPQKGPLVAALLTEGYTLAATDAHGDNWGNGVAAEDYRRLSDDLASRLPGYRTVLLAQSMGGLSSLRFMAERPGEVAAWAGIYPVTNASTMAKSARFGKRLNSARSAADPDPLAASDALKPVPMLAWASPADTMVPKSDNADELARRVQAAGGQVSVVATVGEHGDASNFQPERLVDFFRAALAP